MTVIALFEAIGLHLLVILRSRRKPNQPLLEEAVPHSCGGLNPPDAKYCRRCGEALTMGLCAELGAE